MRSPKSTDEPYDLAGRRIVFTSWYHVRPAYAWWYDKRDKMLNKAASLDPWEGLFPAKDCPWGIRLIAEPAERTGPLLRVERPWEEHGVTFHTVLFDDGMYRAWGTGEAPDRGSWPCYFESKDGVQWERPALGLVEYDGSRQNNLCDIGVRANILGACMFKDPSAQGAERYKCVTGKTITAEDPEAYYRAYYRKYYPDDWELRAALNPSRSGCGGSVSPDGLHWTVLDEPLVLEVTDTQNICHYDEALRKYVLYTRTRTVGPRSRRATEAPTLGEGVARRAIGRSESDDFRHFPISETIVEPGPEFPPSDTLYTNCRTAIPGAPDHHLMFPTVWHQSDDTTSIAVASSHNGRLWHFVPGSPVLPTAAFGEWDGGCVFAHPDLVELPNGDFALPYTGYIFPHKYPRGRWRFMPGLAVWPKGRLVALEAAERGEFATVGLVPPGRRLRINALTKRAGGIVVEVAGLNGSPMPGHTFDDAAPIVGDQHWSPVTWKGGEDLGFVEGGAIILRFRMDKAKIFGLQFE